MADEKSPFATNEPGDEELRPHPVRVLLLQILSVALMVAIVWSMIRHTQWGLLGASVDNFGRLLSQSWRVPERALMGLAGGLAVLVAQFGFGYHLITLIRPWRRALPQVSERACMAPLVGGVAASLLTLNLGLCGATPRAYNILLGVLLAFGVLGIFWWARDWRNAARRKDATSAMRSTWPIWICVGFLVVLTIPYALSPAVESDELRYHLAAPATWLRDGRIHYIPYQAFSCFPFLGEMLFMLAMAIGGAEAAKLVHLGQLPVVMGLVGLLALRWGRASGPDRAASGIPIAAACGGVAFIPLVPILAAWGFVDLFMTAYFLAFVYLAGRALSRRRRAAGSLVGVMAAGAVGVKYSMLPLVGGLGLVWIALLFGARLWDRRPRLSSPDSQSTGEGAGSTRNISGVTNAARILAATILVAVALGSPWYLKNIAWTGNPFYPLAHSVFDGGDWTTENAEFYYAKAAEKGLHLESPSGLAGRIYEFVLTPYTTTFYPNRFEDHPLGPIPLMAIVLALAGLGLAWLHARKGGAGERRVGVWFVMALLISWVFWFMTYQSNRLLLPTMGLALAGAASGWSVWDRFGGRLARWAVRLVLGVAMLYATLFVFIVLGIPPSEDRAGKADAIATGLGFKSPTQLLDQRLNYRAGARWLNRESRPGEHALLVGEHRTLYFDLPVFASDWFNTPQPIPWIEATPDNDALLDALYAKGVRYVFYNAGELRKYNQPENPTYFRDRFPDEEAYRRFERLWNHPRLKRVYFRALERVALRREGLRAAEVLYNAIDPDQVESAYGERWALQYKMDLQGVPTRVERRLVEQIMIYRIQPKRMKEGAPPEP